MMAIDARSKQSRSDDDLPIVAGAAAFDARSQWIFDRAHGGLRLQVEGDAVAGPEEVDAQRIESVIDSLRPRRLLIDFSGCRRLSSSAFGFIVRIFRHATVCDAQVLAVAPDDHVRGLMRVLGVDAFLLMVEDLDTALAYYEAQGI